MRYWLLRRPPQHYTDINPAFSNQPYDYDKVFVNPKVHEGDVVYLVAAYNELYGWGYIVKKESYRDNELNGRAYRLTQRNCSLASRRQVAGLGRQWLIDRWSCCQTFSHSHHFAGFGDLPRK